MSSRLTARKIVNAYFAKTGYLKPGTDFWRTLNFESKQKWRLYIQTVRTKIGQGNEAAQAAALTDLLPSDLGKKVARIWAKDPQLKQLLASNQAGASPSPSRNSWQSKVHNHQ